MKMKRILRKDADILLEKDERKGRPDKLEIEVTGTEGNFVHKLKDNRGNMTTYPFAEDAWMAVKYWLTNGAFPKTKADLESMKEGQ